MVREEEGKKKRREKSTLLLPNTRKARLLRGEERKRGEENERERMNLIERCILSAIQEEMYLHLRCTGAHSCDVVHFGV